MPKYRVSSKITDELENYGATVKIINMGVRSTGKVRTVEGHMVESGMIDNGGISEVPDGKPKSYIAAARQVIRRRGLIETR